MVSFVIVLSVTEVTVVEILHPEKDVSTGLLVPHPQKEIDTSSHVQLYMSSQPSYVRPKKCFLN